MHSTIFLEPGIIETPEAVDAICLLYTGRDHHGVVLGGEIVGDVEHDVADDTTDRRKGVRCNIFQCILVSGRIFKLWVHCSIGFKGDAVAPVDLTSVSIMIKDGGHLDKDLPAST